MRPKKKKYYTVTDIHRAGINLEPLICPKCKKVGNVVYLQSTHSGHCENCGHINRGK